MESKPKAIRTETAYKKALQRLFELLGVHPDTPEYDELELLLVRMRKYERLSKFQVPKVSPSDCIRLAMEKRELSQKDLQPLIGSRSQVSAVLSGRRPLTLAMIRALHMHMDIPVELLIGEVEPSTKQSVASDWTRFPVKEVVKALGLGKKYNIKSGPDKIMAEACRLAGEACDLDGVACFRQGRRLSAKADAYATHAWLLCAKAIARKNLPDESYDQSKLTILFLQRIARQSIFPDGPERAIRSLNRSGIGYVYLPHFRRTYLDGAVFLVDGRPVIAQTCRYDRLDNFWFVLLHELAHLACGHLQQSDDCFLDDLDLQIEGQEGEADKLALESAIPPPSSKHAAFRTANIVDIKELARELRINDAIVAGRVRYEKKNYRILAQHIGQGEVRKQLLNLYS